MTGRRSSGICGNGGFAARGARRGRGRGGGPGGGRAAGGGGGGFGRGGGGGGGGGGRGVRLRVSLLPRRADTAEVVVSAIEARAAGARPRDIADDLGRPEGTVRGWLAAFRRLAGRWRRLFTALAQAVAPGGPPLAGVAGPAARAGGGGGGRRRRPRPGRAPGGPRPRAGRGGGRP